MDNWIKGAGHFGISVADLDESIDFYQNLLGLKVSLKRGKRCIFSNWRRRCISIITVSWWKRGF